MLKRRALNAVVHNFLESYTSRHCDYRGYWLFGLLVRELDRLEVDLLASRQTADQSLSAVAADLAVVKFTQQLTLAGFTPSSLREACLTITKLPEGVLGQVNGHTRLGSMVRFSARAISDRGKSHDREKVIFVAPHDAWIEWRRGGW